MENRLTAMEAELAEIKGMKDLTDKKPEKTTSWLQPTVVTEQPRDAVVDNFVLSLIERVDWSKCHRSCSLNLKKVT